MHCVPYGKDDKCRLVLGGLVQVNTLQYNMMKYVLRGIPAGWMYMDD
jgi:hypothetical protein